MNSGWDKTGLPDSNSDFTKGIYLYKGESIMPYDINRILKPQISAIQHGMPWLYVYVRLKDEEKASDTLFDALRKECAQQIGAELCQRYNELFPAHKLSPPVQTF